jgi:hypothetical protein
LVGTGTLRDGIACDDGVGAHFTGTELRQFVAARPNARAYRVERAGHGARETPLEVRLL